MKYLITILGLVLLSCNNRHDNFYNGNMTCSSRNGKMINLTPEKVNLELFGIFFPHTIGDYIVVENDLKDDKFLTIYNINTLENYGRYIHRGRANNEFLNLVTTKDYVVDSSGSKIWLNVDMGGLILFNITESVKNKQTVIDKKIYANNANNISALSYLNDSLVVGVQYAVLDRHLVVYNYNSDSIVSLFNLYTHKSNDLFLYSGQSRLKPDGTKWVNFTFPFDQINFYSFQDKKSISVTTSKKATSIESISQIESENRKIYYGDMWCNDDIIIAIYSHKTNEQECNELHIFDWDGNLMHIFTINKTFTGITVDRINNNVYLKNTRDEEIFKVYLGDYYNL